MPAEPRLELMSLELFAPVGGMLAACAAFAALFAAGGVDREPGGEGS